MPADAPGKPSASPLAGAPASASRTPDRPDKPRSAAEHRKSSRHSKLEKADILEMTVTHLQNLRRQQVTAALSSDPAVLGKYRAGFNECLVEVTRFLAGCEGVRAEVRSRLLGHLAACLLQLGSSRRPASLPAAAEDPASEVYAGRPLLRSLDGPFPLFTPLLAPGLTPAPPVVPRVGPQGRNGPWRPWLQ
uniref:Hes family bHLH transcription factor 4 n=1 Tax=Sciurus vulgaris TaxID=55149 RepID=A0A8D2AFM4_SCIVU